MKVLLTGASGFVGTYLQREVEAVLLDRGAGQDLDITDAEGLSRRIRELDFDSVVHLAALSAVPDSLNNPWKTYQTNFLGTFNLLQALKQNSFHGKFIFVSSADCYGCVDAASLPIRESAELRPRNPYAVSKACGELLVRQWTACGDASAVIVRPFNLTAPGQSENFVLSSFAKQLMEIKLGKRSQVEVGNLSSTRDFTDVRDACSAFALLLERGAPGEIYNICSGVERTLSDVLAAMAALAGVSGAVQPRPERMRAADTQRSVGDPSRLQSLEWKPRIPFEQTLAELLQHWERKLLG